MSKKISIGLIGLGGFGRMHFQVLLSPQLEHRVTLVAVSDPQIDESSPDLAGARQAGARVYRCHKEMLAREELDAVAIAAPIPVHYDIARDCIATGIYVYLEKPPVPCHNQLLDLIEQDHRTRVAVGFQRIGADWSRTIKEWIVTGKLGELRDIRAAACWPRTTRYYQRTKWAGRMSLDGRPTFDGPATNALAHLVHNIMFFGSAEERGFATPTEVQGELYRARPIESYDTTCLRGILTSGAQFYAAFSHASVEELPYQIEVRGELGWARVCDDGRELESSFGSWGCHQDDWSLLLRSYHSFLDFVAGLADRPITSLRDTLGYSATTNALLQSSGGIHTISADHVTIRGTEPEDIYDIDNLNQEIRECWDSQCLFSEKELPWAVPPSLIPIPDILGTLENSEPRHHLAAGIPGKID